MSFYLFIATSFYLNIVRKKYCVWIGPRAYFALKLIITFFANEENCQLKIRNKSIFLIKYI